MTTTPGCAGAPASSATSASLTTSTRLVANPRMIAPRNGGVIRPIDAGRSRADRRRHDVAIADGLVHDGMEDLLDLELPHRLEIRAAAPLGPPSRARRRGRHTVFVRPASIPSTSSGILTHPTGKVPRRCVNPESPNPTGPILNPISPQSPIPIRNPRSRIGGRQSSRRSSQILIRPIATLRDRMGFGD